VRQARIWNNEIRKSVTGFKKVACLFVDRELLILQKMEKWQKEKIEPQKD
jgi:hypothetical protein